MKYNFWHFSSEKRNHNYLFGLIMSHFHYNKMYNNFRFKGTHKNEAVTFNWSAGTFPAVLSSKAEAGQHHTPGLLLRLDEADDVLHPEHEVTHHTEEAELVSGVQQSRPPALAGLQQTPPGLQHLALTPLDVVRFVSSIRWLQAHSVLLQLPDLSTPAEKHLLMQQTTARRWVHSFWRSEHSFSARQYQRHHILRSINQVKSLGQCI